MVNTMNIDAVPETVLSQPGRNLLKEILEINTDWKVDFAEIDGAWFLIDKARNGVDSLTPIEIFELEETNLF